METITVSSKGQVAIPKAIRNQLGLSAGTRLQLEVRRNELVLTKAQDWRELGGAARGTHLLNAYERQKALEKDREHRRR